MPDGIPLKCVQCHAPFTYTKPVRGPLPMYCSRTCCTVAYNNRHRMRVRERVAKWREQNQEKVKKANKEWMTKNKDRHYAAKKEWVKKHPEKRKQYKQHWYNTENGRAYLKKVDSDPERIKLIRPRQLSRRNLLRSKRARICVTCGCTDLKNLHCHHRDLNPFNKDLENLEWLCYQCHQKLHAALRKAASQKFPE